LATTLSPYSRDTPREMPASMGLLEGAAEKKD